jgi:acyl-CoA synthetase (AMP-forming)/AMP-acid ligase II
MMQFYGASEAPMPLTALHPDQHLDDGADGRLPRLASAGRPNVNVELKIIGAQGETLPQGETGEIAARGDHITPGYWQQPEATAEVLDDQGWLRTGDVGYLDEHGFLFIVDRKKDMIVTGGFNVFPREVENAISTMDGVREVAVVAAPSVQWGEQIVAVVVLTPAAELTPADVIEYCRGLIGRYKIPKEVMLVDELPKSATGKIDKRSIREELWAGHGRRV